MLRTPANARVLTRRGASLFSFSPPHHLRAEASFNHHFPPARASLPIIPRCGQLTSTGSWPHRTGAEPYSSSCLEEEVYSEVHTLFDAAAIWADDKRGTPLERKKVTEQMPFVFVALLLVMAEVTIVFSVFLLLRRWL
jgi:hypothetical protein